MQENNRVLLLSCCAPCSAGAIAQLCARGDDFAVLFYNPNIYPETEYQKRLAEQIKLCDAHGVQYHILEYDHDAWLNDVRGLENEPERGARCAACFRHRFRRALQFAHDNGYTHIASVFGVSKHKDQTQVDNCVRQATDDTKQEIIYLPIKWNEDLRVAENKKFDFYRQQYCGCEFSIRK